MKLFILMCTFLSSQMIPVCRKHIHPIQHCPVVHLIEILLQNYFLSTYIISFSFESILLVPLKKLKKMFSYVHSVFI